MNTHLNPTSAKSTIVTVRAEDGHHLLSIHHNGDIEGEICDASEAGRAFADAVAERMTETGLIVRPS